MSGKALDVRFDFAGSATCPAAARTPGIAQGKGAAPTKADLDAAAFAALVGDAGVRDDPALCAGASAARGALGGPTVFGGDRMGCGPDRPECAREGLATA